MLYTIRCKVTAPFESYNKNTQSFWWQIKDTQCHGQSCKSSQSKELFFLVVTLLHNVVLVKDNSAQHWYWPEIHHFCMY